MSKSDERKMEYIRKFGSMYTPKQIAEQLGYKQEYVYLKLREMEIPITNKFSQKRVKEIVTFDEFCSGNYIVNKSGKNRPKPVYDNKTYDQRIEEYLNMEI